MANSDQVAELKERAVALAPRIAELILDKAVRHLEDPAKYPLGPGDSAERKLVDRLSKLNERRRGRLFDRIRDLCRPKDRAAHFGPLAAVDLMSPVPLAIQIEEKLAEHLPRPAAVGNARAATSTARASFPGSFRLHVSTVEQIKKTIGAFEGKDEIRLQGTIFNQEDIIKGSASSIREIDLGQFQRHEKRNVNQDLGSVSFLADRGFPQTFVVILELFEVDRAKPNTEDGDAFGASFAAVFGLVLMVAAVFSGPGLPVITLLALLQMPVTAFLTKAWYEDDAFQPFVLTETFGGQETESAPTVCEIQHGQALHGHYDVTVKGLLV